MKRLKEAESVIKLRKMYYRFKNRKLIKDRQHIREIIRQYKDIHKGEKCIIVGNGPSLRVDDLNRIHELGIPSFACNRIFKVFDQTEWRPAYYFISDEKLLEGYPDEVDGVPANHRFFPVSFRSKIKNGVFYLPGPENVDFEKEGRFSLDAARGVYGGGSVTTEMLQFAYYMGFSEIYLIGVDFSYAINNPLNGKDYTYNGENNYFIKDYLKPGEVANIPNIQANLLAFHAAKQETERNNCKIYNATRGGKLEVFDRTDLDTFFDTWRI